MTPTLKQLHYFVALAETLHYGRAAMRCHITQPALSMQMRELEATLRAALVERTPQGLMLTAEGEEVARRARAILLAVGELVDWTRHAGGALRLSAAPRQLFVDEFALALTEIFSNQAEHAYAGRGGRVQGRLSVGPDWMRADVFDSGVPFVPPVGSEQPAIDPADPPERGYGLRLVRALTDHFEYTRLDGGRNHWSLVKYVSGEVQHGN